MIANHLAITNTALESLDCDATTTIVANYLREMGGGRESLNYVVARFEEDHVICLTSDICGDIRGAISVIRDGRPCHVAYAKQASKTRAEAIKVALRMAENYRQV